MSEPSTRERRVLWPNVVTVLSAAILIGTVVIGTGLATGWALAGMFGLGDIGRYILEALFVGGAIAFVVAFVRNAMRVEPFVER